MTYKQWENKLSEYLCELPLAELEEILGHYRYQYEGYTKQGYTNNEILDSFGSPRAVSEKMLKKREENVKKANRNTHNSMREEEVYAPRNEVRSEPIYTSKNEGESEPISSSDDSEVVEKKKGAHGFGGLLFRLIFSLPFGIVAKVLDIVFWVVGVALVVGSIGGLGYAIYSAMLFLYGLAPIKVLACFSMGLISIGVLIIVGTIIRHISGKFSKVVKKINRRVLKGERGDEEKENA